MDAIDWAHGHATFGHETPNHPSFPLPRVAASCDFQGPARFEEELSIAMFASHVGRSSLRYRFEITREDAPIATGSITVVACDLSDAGLKKVPLPDAIRECVT